MDIVPPEDQSILSHFQSVQTRQGYVLITNEMHNSYDKFLFHSVLSALHVSNESSRSSSGAQHNILYYTVQSVQSVQSCYQASLAA